MTNFINNLVQKGAGLRPMTVLEPPSLPIFKKLTNPSISGKEESTVDYTNNSLEISGEEPQKPAKLIDDKMSNSQTASSEELQRSSIIKKNNLELSIDNKPSVNSAILTIDSITSKKHGSLSKHIKSKVENQQKPSFGQPQPVDKLSDETKTNNAKADNEYISTIEPKAESPYSVPLELTINKNDGSSKQKSSNDSTENNKIHKDKEVRVNIGRIEVKAEQQYSPPSSPPVRGFDDYLMMRVYLDRHYI